ncbi:ligase-associated DNA damage response DEXH box helicase [Propylenella binzhouense]|uniref:Ligase-associated DNA damage response DEXH box helicase n=1 Tax=Propylenella binzhouense TaxID=2555902 RepID=A0A964T842_9HYPH|nr:ligase-associated DNA damage response DEXH box helicase [Propylenella binzhouense]
MNRPIHRTPPAETLLPPRFGGWFAARGWAPRPHQLALLEKAQRGLSSLLIAPTGAGKTLAGFLPSLVELSEEVRAPGAPVFGPHTLYVSPLKALAVDIARNLEQPVAEMALPVRLETRTGDTPLHKRQRQKLDPPDILLTTPEQVALLAASKDARRFFSRLSVVIFDELHSLVVSKRGDLLALDLARLRTLAPGLRTIGLSATVAEPDDLRAWLVAQSGPEGERNLSELVLVEGGARPDLAILASEAHIPWQGHSARYALPEIYRAIKAHRTTLLFVNTRWQAEMLFQELWTINEDALPIALHHGSLDRGQRRRVEAAMAAGSLRAVVATSTLDLGIDWGDVDLVVHVGAPKGASRLAQRIGRANHRMDEPSKGILVPANRFEVLECRAALDANYIGAQDTPPLRAGALDVLCQHILGMAVAEPFDAVALHREIVSAAPYRRLDWETFERAVDFVATGGYALRAYERFARIRRRKDGSWGITHPRIAQQYRLNVGTIVESPMLNVRLGRKGGAAGRGGRMLGQVEEYFVETLVKGDTFRFAGRTLRFEGIRDNEAFVSNAASEDPQIPSYAGGKFPLTTYLAAGVRRLLTEPESWRRLPPQVREWLEIQREKSRLPGADELMVETFPLRSRHYMVAFPFEGRLAHQTLGMLLTRRLERAGARPLGFVATDYALAVWALRDLGALFADGRPSLAALFDEDMLGDDLEAWLADSYLLKRTFRTCAVIAGLIERRHPGQEKTGRQVTVSTDLVYDVLRSHEPDHILLQATRADAATGLLDIARLGEMLSRVKGRIGHQRLSRVSPLSVPILLEIGREPVFGEAQEDMMADAAEDLLREAMGEAHFGDGADRVAGGGLG